MTEKITSKGTGIDAFERMLDTFGSDRTRWPAPARRDFASLVTTSGEAGARLKEAEALDRLLDLAAPPRIDTSALAARIVAAAEAEASAARAVPAAAGTPATRTRKLFERHNGRRPAAETPWAAVALLAASLVLGIFTGFSGAFDPAVRTVVADAEAAFDSDIDADQIAFDSDSISMFEGDML